jgi:GNAT superfamily N-acetyltransferase
MTESHGVRFRTAVTDDAPAVAALHADSWRRHYRGVYSDAFLDGDVEADRQLVWGERFALLPSNESFTVVAEDDQGLVGFTHVIFGADPDWGSLLDNLHVRFGSKRQGVGRELMTRSLLAASERATPLYLWVLEANVDARAFYEACGGICVERAPVTQPGGIAGRLVGEHFKLRMAWADPGALLGDLTDG